MSRNSSFLSLDPASTHLAASLDKKGTNGFVYGAMEWFNSAIGENGAQGENRLGCLRYTMEVRVQVRLEIRVVGKSKDEGPQARTRPLLLELVRALYCTARKARYMGGSLRFRYVVELLQLNHAYLVPLSMLASLP